MGAGGGGVGFGGHHVGGAGLSRRVISSSDAARETMSAARGMLDEDRQKDPSREWRTDHGLPQPWPAGAWFWVGFLVGAFVISIPWWIFWENT